RPGGQAQGDDGPRGVRPGARPGGRGPPAVRGTTGMDRGRGGRPGARTPRARPALAGEPPVQPPGKLVGREPVLAVQWASDGAAAGGVLRERWLDRNGPAQFCFTGRLGTNPARMPPRGDVAWTEKRFD